jgi:hypothetical protein
MEKQDSRKRTPGAEQEIEGGFAMRTIGAISRERWRNRTAE